jgi:type III pantothenate kinase
LSELDRDVLAISAVTGEGIPQLIYRIIELLRKRAEPQRPAASVSVPIAASAVTAPGG